MTKPGRNLPCPCGSGLKYKNCCQSKRAPEEQPMILSAESLCGVLKFGLENAHLFNKGALVIRVKSVSFLNGGDTLLVEFFPVHRKGSDIKGEMAYIMSFLFSFLKDDAYQIFKINMFAARAFDDQGNELMYAINNRSAAAAIIGGNCIEWLRTTIFQENTADYRLSRAKTMIAEIEQGLRTAISSTYLAKHGLGWWDLLLEPKLSKAVKSTYENQFGISETDGSILIEYTFTLQLKQIISADWGTFRHLFTSKMDFEATMVSLNAIRREEAHNRDISELHLLELEQIYDKLLAEIASIYPAVTTNFLIDNWRTKIRESMVNPPGTAYTAAEFQQADILGRAKLLINSCTAEITFMSNAVEKLRSLKPPVSKKNKHGELIILLEEMVTLQRRRLEQLEHLNLDGYLELEKLIDEQKNKMDIFSRKFVLEES